MKLDEFKPITEMAKAATICPMCGYPTIPYHTYRKTGSGAEWRCKGNVTPKPGYPLPGAKPIQASAKGAAAVVPTAVPVSPPEPESKAVGDEVAAHALTSPGTEKAATTAPVAATSSDVQAQIGNWLKSKGVTNFTFDENGHINVEGDCKIEMRRPELPGPVQFGIVTGNFVVGAATLKTLRGFPREVGTREYGGNCLCNHNEFETMEGGPKTVGGTLSVTGNKHLRLLTGMPEHIAENFLMKDCVNVKSLEGIHKMCKHIGGTFDASGCDIESNVLGLLRIKGLEHVVLKNAKVAEILNKYLKGDAGNIHDAQEELIDAGFEDYANF